MNLERPTPHEPTPLNAPSEPAEIPGRCYVPSAPMADVLIDQLEYLLAHSGDQCAPECLECGRLQQVKNWLLLPFHSPAFPS